MKNDLNGLGFFVPGPESQRVSADKISYKADRERRRERERLQLQTGSKKPEPFQCRVLVSSKRRSSWSSASSQPATAHRPGIAVPLGCITACITAISGVSHPYNAETHNGDTIHAALKGLKMI